MTQYGPPWFSCRPCMYSVLHAHDCKICIIYSDLDVFTVRLASTISFVAHNYCTKQLSSVFFFFVVLYIVCCIYVFAYILTPDGSLASCVYINAWVLFHVEVCVPRYFSETTLHTFQRCSVRLIMHRNTAFDTVEHSVLLRRLENCFGVTGTAIAWIGSYLSDRSQFVRMDSSCSTVVNCSAVCLRVLCWGRCFLSLTRLR